MSTTVRPISLAHLTVLDTTPPELVTVAAAAGFRTIGIRLTAPPSVGVPPYDILHEGPLLRDDASADMPGPTDAPALIREARAGRLLPGEGVLPLRELVAALPAGVPLAIEAPCRAGADLPAVERAKRAYQALSTLLSTCSV